MRRFPGTSLTSLRSLASAFLLMLTLSAGPAMAQDDGVEIDPRSTTVIQSENVRFDYAQVMRVRPVHQTLHATRMEQRCETPSGIVVVAPKGEEPGRFERFINSVREVFGADSKPKTVAAIPKNAENCELVEVERAFQRPIAFDVDYVYKGAKYRSRLPHDPGNHLRVRVSVTPIVSSSDE